MKRLLLSIILCGLIVTAMPQKANAGFWGLHKAGIEKTSVHENSAKEIRRLFALQDKYTNSYEYENLFNIYSDDFINSDGYDKNLYFKLIKETWETYPDITYKTVIEKLEVNGSFAYVETNETAFAVAEEDSEEISAAGELYSKARCIYYLKKENGKWLISGEDILEEHSSLKFGDARFIKMELNAPNYVAAGSHYASELKVDMPEDQIVIASISRENITQPAVRAAEKYRKLPPEQRIERLFTANTDNVNEYNIASVGVTKTEPVDDENVKVYMNGLAFLMTRVKVVPKNTLIDLKGLENGKTE